MNNLAVWWQHTGVRPIARENTIPREMQKIKSKESKAFWQKKFIAIPCEWPKSYLNCENNVRLGAFFSLSSVWFLCINFYVCKIFQHPRQRELIFKSGSSFRVVIVWLPMEGIVTYAYIFQSHYNFLRIVMTVFVELRLQFLENCNHLIIETVTILNCNRHIYFNRHSIP